MTASRVWAAACGVTRRLGAWSRGSSTRRGSLQKTSSPAAVIWPDVRACSRSASLTIPPRLVLIRSAVFFIRASSDAQIRFRVASTSGICTETISDVRRRSSLFWQYSTPHDCICSFEKKLSKPMTFMPMPRQIFAVSRPIGPRPIMPTVLPSHWKALCASRMLQ